MSRIVQPSDFHHHGPARSTTPRGYLFGLVKSAGIKGVLALVGAAIAAFFPLVALLWFNTYRFETVPLAAIAQRVQVKPEQTTDDAEKEEPGETALLQIFCEVPAVDGWRTLYAFDDSVSRASDEIMPRFANHEAAYLRPRSDVDLPFGLLGLPPLSVWLPPGDYEILVVYRAGRDWEAGGDAPPLLPLAESRYDCTLEDRQRTVARVGLPHYESPPGIPLRDARPAEPVSSERLATFCQEIEQATAVPTPGGVLLNLAAPAIHHQEEHRDCTVHFDELVSTRREWTREQLAELRAWLPADATAARSRLDAMISSLDWRASFQGWFCYAAAGIAGLVFTRWGTIRLLDPSNRRPALRESIPVAIAVFLLAVAVWFVGSLVAKLIG